MASPASMKEEAQKKEEEIAALRETCIDKFTEGAKYIKANTLPRLSRRKASEVGSGQMFG